jgi:hypothetical protein
MKKVTIFVVLACLLFLTLGVAPVYADEVPALPHAFYGSVSINGSPAPAGTSVEARGEGVATDITGNPTITSVSGIYGTSNPLEPRLIVQGNIEEEATITFYVNDVSTGQTAEWHSGETTELNLSVTISKPPPTPPPAAPPVTPTIDANLFGSAHRFSISTNGEVLETITATSPDGKLTITIPAGTVARKDGKPLSSLTVDVDPSPPDPPEGDTIIGLVYDFGPEGATFDPPITITFAYDPDEVPEGAELLVVVWDEDADEWVEVEAEDYTVSTETNTITLLVSGFSKYAIIARGAPALPAPAVFSLSNLTIQPAEVEPGGMVNIAVEVANTGGTAGNYTVVLQLNGTKEAEKSVTVATGSSKIVTFSVTKEVAGSYSVTVDGLNASFTVAAPPPPEEVEEEIIAPPEEEVEEEAEEEIVPAPTGIAWWVWLIIGVVVVAAILVGFVWVRRRAY